MSSIAIRRRLQRAAKRATIRLPQNIVYRKVEDLVPYARNARTHSTAQIGQIAASIQEFGFTVPVLIDADNELIAGHARVLAAQLIELAEVPCLVLGHLTEAQRRAYRLADNQLALNAGWDFELVGEELDILNDDVSFNIDLIGFDDEQLASIWKDQGLGTGGDAARQQAASTWAVIVECEDEASQVELIERLQEEGYNVRGSIS